MPKRRISTEEVSHVLRLARQGNHLREIARLSGVSTSGVTGICARAGVYLKKVKPGPLKTVHIR
jgi:hypothetical protein